MAEAESLSGIWNLELGFWRLAPGSRIPESSTHLWGAEFRWASTVYAPIIGGGYYNEDQLRSPFKLN